MLFGAEKYAVLITGDYADERGDFEGSWAISNNLQFTENDRMEEFWHDTYLMWEMLIEKGYTNENIYVLFADGVDFQPTWIDNRYSPQQQYPNLFPNPGDQLTNYPADIASVNNVFTGLANGTGGLPQLQEDDFLFCWTFDHGGGGQVANLGLIDGVIWDYEFAALTDQINCQKKVFWMQQCHSGGFIDNLQGEDTYINTSCHYSTGAVRCDNETVSGNPVIEMEILGGHQYYHGEFNFHLYSSTNGCSPAYYIHYPENTGEPYTNADTNGDGIISVEESKDWEADHESEGATPQYADDGYIGETTSIEYPNIILSNITSSQTFCGIIAIPFDLSVTSGVSFTIADNSKIYLLNESQLTIEEGAFLNIGNNVTFEGEAINDCGVITLNSTGQTNFEDTHFKYCNLICSNGSIVMADSDFLGCYLSSENGELNISDSEFNDETWSYHSYGILSNNDDEFYLNNVNVENYYQGIRLNYPVSFKINNSISQNNYSHNFFVMNSRGINNEIYNSQFTGSSVGHGLNIYGSSLTATSCYIAHNGSGILLMNRSNVTVQKDPTSYPWYLDSVILDNSWSEVVFYDDCRIHLADNRNKIIDNSYTPGTSDEFLINCPNLMTERDFSYNYWGYTDMYNNAILPPDNRFNPEGAYNLSPVYDPGIPREDGKPDDQILYETAVLEAENGNTVQADIMLKDLITQYPESDYKRSSASYLLSIQDDDFQSLKTYFINEPNLHSNDLIELYTAYLQTYCDIQSENYQEAIDWFESIITNPPSLADSVYAVIDLGDLYLQMGGNGRGAVGRYAELIPQSRVEFEETREDLLALLSEEYNFENEPEEEPSNNSLPTCVTLNDNYPNPFNPTTTISFSIPDENRINLTIYNLKGQKVKTLVNNDLDKGIHSVVWNGIDESGKSVSSGVYFYKLSVNGNSKSVKKCLMMK